MGELTGTDDDQCNQNRREQKRIAECFDILPRQPAHRIPSRINVPTVTQHTWTIYAPALQLPERAPVECSKHLDGVYVGLEAGCAPGGTPPQISAANLRLLLSRDSS